MPTAGQYNTTLQPYRDVDIKIYVLDYEYNLLDEISGIVISADVAIDADSDVRRTADISMTVRDSYTDTTSNIISGVNPNVYWTAGNPYWFDKYIKIEVGIQNILTSEYEWVNQGIYLVNSPTINYSADTNELSFQAVDLMAKLTGMRNGYMKGMTYTFPMGSTITGCIEAILLEQGFTKYIIYTPDYNELPEDISIEAGGTAYDILTQLRDINSNWEMFFDLDGVFIFQQIPSGKVIVDPSTGEEGEPTPLIDDTIWQKTLLDFSLDTSFEDVKNYIEVLGKTHETDEECEYGTEEITISGETIEIVTATLSNPFSYYDDDEGTELSWIFSFTVGDLSEEPESLVYFNTAADPTYVRLYDSEGEYVDVAIDRTVDMPTNNITYCLRYTSSTDTTTQVTTRETMFLGYLQSYAVAFDNNEESPFYVGDFTGYTCSNGKEVVFTSGELNPITTVKPTYDTTLNMWVVNLYPFIDSSDFGDAERYSEWCFMLEITDEDIEAHGVIDKFRVLYPRGALPTEYLYMDCYIYRTNALIENDYITLDFGNTYYLRLIKDSIPVPGALGTLYDIAISIEYTPLSSALWDSPSVNVYGLPTFDKIIRGVCTGDEYDNIYSNDLAMQRAKYELYLQDRLHDTVSLTTVPIYWLDVNSIIAFTLPNNESGEADLWLVKSISTDLSADGQQSISAMRYYPLYPSN